MIPHYSREDRKFTYHKLRISSAQICGPIVFVSMSNIPANQKQLPVVM